MHEKPVVYVAAAIHAGLRGWVTAQRPSTVSGGPEVRALLWAAMPFTTFMVSVLCLAFLGLWLRVYPRLFALCRSDWSGGIRQRINTTT